MRTVLWFIFGILKGQNVILLFHFIFGRTSLVLILTFTYIFSPF